ncbi:MAG: hypothetical protein KGQ60_08335, partial [Planctomycetes bacterium]|nr:hypothetical protein [Planctomycetota bacterium]
MDCYVVYRPGFVVIEAKQLSREACSIVRKFALLLVCAMASVVSTHGQQAESEKLVDAFVVRTIERSEQYSVLCLMDGTAPAKGGTAESSNGIEVTPSTQIFRIVKSGKLGATRLDHRFGDGLVQFQSLYEHVLVLPGDRLMAFGLKQGDFLLQQPVKKRPNRLIQVDMPGVALQTLSGMSLGTNAYLDNYGNAKYFALKEGKGDRTVLYVAPSRRVTYGRITFDRVGEEMLPVDLAYYESPGGTPVEYGDFSVESCKKWRFILSTSTDWRLHDKYGYLPSRVFFRRENQPGAVEEAEYK